ncbi:MAG: S8 family serine peptidase [Ahniella sp.]|nr:S8 family serine peptidase [Ahniella sp.]
MICDQGRSDALFQKAQRVGSAGAIGLVVANRQRDGNNTAATMISLLPTVHIGYQDGETLKAAVRNARGTANGQIRARIDGMNINGSGRGSVLADSSSKGPVTPFPGYLKPNIAAPGTNIAAAFIPSPTSFDALTGTSMASPHVAGAAALVAAANPTWTPAQIESALLTSATDNMLLEDGLNRARYFEAGAGMLNVPAALKSGLHFATTQAEFLAADPQTGGNPTTLNQPYLHSDSCVRTCTFTRSVTANVGGSWTLGATMPAGVSVSFNPGAIALTARPISAHYGHPDDESSEPARPVAGRHLALHEHHNTRGGQQHGGAHFGLRERWSAALGSSCDRCRCFRLRLADTGRADRSGRSVRHGNRAQAPGHRHSGHRCRRHSRRRLRQPGCELHALGRPAHGACRNEPEERHFC